MHLPWECPGHCDGSVSIPLLTGMLYYRFYTGKKDHSFNPYMFAMMVWFKVKQFAKCTFARKHRQLLVLSKNLLKPLALNHALQAPMPQNE